MSEAFRKKMIQDKLQFLLTRIFFGITILLALSELFEWKDVFNILKPTLLPILMLLYLCKSQQKNIFYILALFFGWLSNISFMFTEKEFVVYGFLAFMCHRILCIVVTFRLINKFYLLPFIIAIMPCLFIFSSLLNLTLNPDAPEFYPAVANALLISILSGIALSNYVMDDSKINSWLAISTLLFVVLVFLFMIQKYYISNIVFQPISAIIFAFGHYTFYRFIIEGEKSNPLKTTL